MNILILILDVFLILIGMLLVILGMMLFIPFRYEISGTGKEEGICGETYVSWLYGGVKFGISKEADSKSKMAANILGFKIYPPNIKKKKKNNKKKKAKAKNKPSEFNVNIIKPIWNYCTDVIRIVSPKKVRIHGSYGFEDPSLTGYLCGVINIIQQFAPSYWIDLEPCFEESRFDIDIEVKGDMYLSVVGFKTLKFIFKKDIRKLIFKKRKNMKLFPSM